MKNKKSSKKALAAALALSFGAVAVNASTLDNAFKNPVFSLTDLNANTSLIAHGTEAKCGEGKCGEGKCGAGKKTKTKAKTKAKKSQEAKCGEGKCGAEKKAPESKSQEAKCGEGKCGAGKKAE